MHTSFSTAGMPIGNNQRHASQFTCQSHQWISIFYDYTTANFDVKNSPLEINMKKENSSTWQS